MLIVSVCGFKNYIKNTVTPFPPCDIIQDIRFKFAVQSYLFTGLPVDD